jgi:hypothetical protein
MNMLRQFRLSAMGLLLCGAAYGAIYPVKISTTNPRILVDRNDNPFLIVGDSPHSLFSNLSSADAAAYLADRAARGINSLWVNLLCVRPVEGRPDGSLLDGTRPFVHALSGTKFYELTTPNEPYFAHVDEVLRMAATNGIVVMVDPLETAGPLLPTALSNGSTRCRAYGQYLGSRYKDFPNIVWLHGNDFQRWNMATNDAVITSVAWGIKDKDANHLHTIELNYQSSSSLDDANWAPIVGLNLAYTYYATYTEVLHAYNQSPNVAMFMGEANFEYETNGVAEGAEDGGSPHILRMQEYWTMLSGVTGQLYGNRYIWRFLPGWQSHLDSPGIVQLGYMENLFRSRKWFDLVPDQAHTFVTAGYGTFASVPASHAIVQRFATNDYVTAALTRDGSLGIAYLPQGGTITVAMGRLRNGINASWFDPCANTFRALVGSTFSKAGSRQFTAPGKNSTGDPDWVLVLETIR